MLGGPLRKIGNYYLVIEKLNNNTESEVFCDIFSVQKYFSSVYALKLYRKGFSEKNLEKQVEIYALLGQKENPYFLRYISNSKDEFIAKDKYIVLEYTEKGTLKDYLLFGKFFSEKLCIIVVWKIFQAVIQMHDKGIIHLNINLENILVNGDYNFKISGFDHAINIKKEKPKKDDNVFTEDIHSLAFLIIQLLTGKVELKQIQSKLKMAIKKGNFEAFWMIIDSQDEYSFSQELKDLIKIMFSGQISKVDNLLSHNWFEKIRNSINQNEFANYEQYMKNELACYERGRNDGFFF